MRGQRGSSGACDYVDGAGTRGTRTRRQDGGSSWWPRTGARTEAFLIAAAWSQVIARSQPQRPRSGAGLRFRSWRPNLISLVPIPRYGPADNQCVP